MRDVVDILMQHHYCEYYYDTVTMVDIKDCWEGDIIPVMADWGIVATREYNLACSEDPMNMHDWDNMVIWEIPEYSPLS